VQINLLMCSCDNSYLPKVDQIRNFCCAPSFVIGMAGPWFCILGGVFLSRAVIQPLTDFIPLTINLRVSDQVKRISQLFYSLLLAIRELRDFYHNLRREETEIEQRFFPYIRHYKVGETVHRFTYLCGLLDDHTRTIWKAKREDGELIVVKFASKYNIQGHNICAGYKLAPQLLYSSDDEEVKALGGFKMVIMEYICGIPLDQKYLKGGILPRSCVTIIENVTMAIELLHEKDFVFGDLRAPNVLIVDTDDGQRAVLVDFDWCGKNELDEYPSSMNKKLDWPLGAEPCALLQKEHDLYWITKLMTDYLRYILLSFSKLA
jgi:serine/threonine protein kinase